MNCRFCGAQLTGTEVTCPTCGNMVNPQAVNPGVTNAGVGQVGVPAVNGTSQVMQTAGIPEMPVATGAPEVSSMSMAQPMMGANQGMPGVYSMPQTQGQPPVGGEIENPGMMQNPMQAGPTPIDPMTVAGVSGGMGAAPTGGDTQNPGMIQNPVQAGPMPIDPMTVAGTSGGMMNDPSNNMGMANPGMQSANPMMTQFDSSAMQSSIVGQTPQQGATQGQKPPKVRKKIPVIYLILGAAVLIVVGYYIFMFATGAFDDGAGSSGSSGGGTSTSTEEDGEEEDTSSVQSYAGFKFSIPDGYTAEVTDYGLLVASYDTAYYIALDYTNQYEGYQSYFAGLYPDQANNINNKFSNRDFLIISYQGADATYGTKYVSKTSDDHLFVGVVLKNGGIAAVPNDFADLSSILDGAEVDSNNTVSTGDDLDLGKTGAYEAMPTASEVTFNSD